MMRSQVLRAFGVVMGFTMLSRLTGFTREMALAYGLGASALSDAYLVGFTVPNLVGAILGVAAGKAILPLFAAHLAEGRHDLAWRLASTALNLTAIACLALIGLGWLFTEQIVRLLTPGFRPEALALAASATRVMLPGLFFYCTGALITAMLQAMRSFGLPAAAPVAQNLVLTAGALLVPLFGLEALAWVALLTMSMELLVPALGVVGKEMRYSPSVLDLHEARRTLSLALPLMAGALVYQIGTAVDWAVASTTGAGSIAALNFADRIRQIPVGLFSATAATVLYPTLAELAATGQMERFRRTMAEGLYALLAVMAPCAAGLMLLRAPFVMLLFERGAFDAAATEATATALFWYAPGLVGLGAAALLSVGFYSLHDTTTPVAVGLVGAGANMALNVLLVFWLGHGGVAAANSIASVGTAIALYLLLSRRLGGLPLPWGSMPLKTLLRR